MLRIGHLSTFYHTALLLSKKEDLLKESLREEIQWKLFGTGPAIIKAFEEGEIDLAFIGLTPTIAGIDKGLEIICIAGGHVNGTVISGRRELLGFTEVDDLKSLFQQFRNLRIAAPSRGSIHDIILRELLRRYGLLSAVKILNYPWADQILEDFSRGRIDVAVGTPNLAVLIRRFSGGKILWPPEGLWPYNPSYGIVVKKDLLLKREMLKRFLQLHEEETLFLRREPEKASEIISSIVGVLEKDVILEILLLSPHYCSMLTEEYISSTMELMEAMKDLGYIRRSLTKEDIFYTGLIKEIHPPEGHY